MTRPLLVLGASGQVGRAFAEILPSVQPALFWGRAQADLNQPETLRAALDATSPSAIINAAAYTAVDAAEADEATAMRVNAQSVAVIADFCAARAIPLVHYSTDYVFDGSGDAPWRETDSPAPLNAYARSKWAGEQAVQQSGCAHLLFRTSWVYDAQGNNFFATILRLGKERELLRVVADQIGAPTYAPHLAHASWQALQRAITMSIFPSGVYHICGGGAPVSWHGFAEAIFDAARQRGIALKLEQLEAITTADYPTPAKRPANSRLSMDKLHDVFGITMPDWREGMADAITRYPLS
jgi:dTDP-4-dehydrorhamnose reductase